MDELNIILKDKCQNSNGPINDVDENYSNDQSTKNRMRRNRSNIVRDAITAE
jgi:hypothetical protein